MQHNAKTIELFLDSGIRVHITPLNRYHLKALQDAAQERYPLPDAKAFEKPLSEDVAIPGTVIPADENEEYRTLKAEAERNQHLYVLDAMIDIAVRFPGFPTRADVIAHFADELALQRKHITLPADEWEATWRFAVLRTFNDEAYVYNAVKNELPLTEGEVVDEITIFRHFIPRQATRRLPDRKSET